ncbi:hypothetical protein R3P38DRAFT_3522299 [Favolaschia claudopus]|uniref:DUF6532 domain-containing protein n=1 Tax=Favolaschia claudopus TaxID=2862362 RepID=A0AAW0E1N8_9AGAR
MSDAPPPSPTSPKSGAEAVKIHHRLHPTLGARSDASSAPPAKRSKEYEDAPFREGFVAVRSTKPAAGDYADLALAIIIRACREYSARIAGLYMLPASGVQAQWAQECFRNACGVAKRQYAYTDRIGKIVRARGSQVRGKTIETFRALFAGNYGLERSSSSKIIAANKRKVAQLLQNSAFHYKDPAANPLVGFAENRIIAQVRKATTFRTKESVGIVFPNYFNPISLGNIAMELIAEWSTGSFIASKFTEKAVVDSYEKYVKDVEKWSAMKPTVVENIRKKWYWRASETLTSEVINDNESSINDAQEEALRAELEGRTGAA